MGSGPGTRQDCKGDRPEDKVTPEAPSPSPKAHSTAPVPPLPQPLPLPPFQACPDSFRKDTVRALYTAQHRADKVGSLAGSNPRSSTYGGFG